VLQITGFRSRVGSSELRVEVSLTAMGPRDRRSLRVDSPASEFGVEGLGLSGRSLRDKNLDSIFLRFGLVWGLRFKE